MVFIVAVVKIKTKISKLYEYTKTSYLLCTDEIATNVREEMKRLYNRKQLNFTSTASNNNNQTTSSQLDLNTSNE